MKELQELDCNCSDCFFLERSLSQRQKHVDFHYQMQKDSFNIKRIKLLKRGEFWLYKKKDKKKSKVIFKEARKMVFVFDEGGCSLHYGQCLKYKKLVSFIPNTLQLDTQGCFVHRLNKIKDV